jgi:hypothetical protein
MPVDILPFKVMVSVSLIQAIGSGRHSRTPSLNVASDKFVQVNDSVPEYAAQQEELRPDSLATPSPKS